MRSVYIETYGCQMNVADSELMAGALEAGGYRLVEDQTQADVILLNTCAIREKAEDRIFGRLGWLKPWRQERSDRVLGVTGCMAEHLRDRLTERASHVDVVVGPDAYRRLPDLIDYAAKGPDPMVDVRLDREELYRGVPIKRGAGVSGYLTIMRGCDKFCTFCVVPYVRGRERSVPAAEIVAQARAMVVEGKSEVILLGQTVSSYSTKTASFADLLRRLHEIEGLWRIRFTSPYPSDFDRELLNAIRSLPRVARHLHLPVQSGSTKILRDMRRGYTAEAYRELIRYVRDEMPEFSITTDIIVGYPGETEADFAATLALSAEAEFESAYMFKYSERSPTVAARKRPDDVPEAVKSERLQRLIAQQKELTQRRNALMLGREVEVLVEGPNPRQDGQSFGRSSCFRGVVVAGQFHPGALVRARVNGQGPHTLFAEPNAANSTPV